jgi:1,4-dihydroxy-2-naphthoyl-CoA hydrolase
VEPPAAEPAADRSPFDELVGTRVVEASGERVVAELDVRPEHHQPMGYVHGGVLTTVIETTASVGATLALDGRGVALGVSNTTEFLGAVAAGRLTIAATRLQRSRSLQLWEVAVSDERGRLIAHGTVRLFNRRAGERAATTAH